MRSIYVEKFILLIQLAQFELLRVDSERTGQIASFLSRHCRMINWPNVQLIRKTDLFEALASDLFHKRFKNENPPDKRGPRAREIRRTLFFAFVSLKCRGFEIHGLEFSYSDYLFTSMFMSAHMVACMLGRIIREHFCFDVDEVNIC